MYHLFVCKFLPFIEHSTNEVNFVMNECILALKISSGNFVFSVTLRVKIPQLKFG